MQRQNKVFRLRFQKLRQNAAKDVSPVVLTFLHVETTKPSTIARALLYTESLIIPKPVAFPLHYRPLGKLPVAPVFFFPIVQLNILWCYQFHLPGKSHHLGTVIHMKGSIQAI